MMGKSYLGLPSRSGISVGERSGPTSRNTPSMACHVRINLAVGTWGRLVFTMVIY